MKEKTKETKIDRVAKLIRKKAKKPQGQSQGESSTTVSDSRSEVDNSNLIQVGGINDFHEQVKDKWLSDLGYSLKN